MSINTKQSTMTLRSDRLAVEVAAPGSAYAGTRFDWTGFVTQVTLDGRHTFCMPESLEPGQGTGGIGLCSEFGNDKAIGYADAAPGDLFPKLGIGLLKRPDAAEYNFFRPYEIAQPFSIQVDAPSASQARFVVAPLDCRGYAAQLTKTISARENWLEIACRLENVGRRVIDTNEYAHNFLGINQNPLGPAYRLRFPYPIQLEDLSAMLRGAGMALPDILRVNGNDLTLSETPERAFYCRPLGFFKTKEPQWELIHLPSGAGLREYDDFAPVRVAVWGTTHVISAEVFTDICLQPGETACWTRRYEFL